MATLPSVLPANTEWEDKPNVPAAALPKVLPAHTQWDKPESTAKQPVTGDDADFARASGLDPQKIAAAAGPPSTLRMLGLDPGEWKETAKETGAGMESFAKSVLRDPFNLANVVEGPARAIESGKPGAMMAGASQALTPLALTNMPGTEVTPKEAGATGTLLRTAEGKIRTPVKLAGMGAGYYLGKQTGLPLGGYLGALALSGSSPFSMARKVFGGVGGGEGLLGKVVPGGPGAAPAAEASAAAVEPTDTVAAKAEMRALVLKGIEKGLTPAEDARLTKLERMAAPAVQPSPPAARPVGRQAAAPPPATAGAPEPIGPTRPPNAAGQSDFTGLRTSREQGVIQPREPGRTVGDRLLPSGPPEIGQTANPKIRAGVAGPTIETPKEATAAPGPKPTTRQQVGKIVDTALGVEPLNPKVRLRDQLGKSADVPANPKTALEEKYPEKAVRQMVHANGEKIVQAIGKDPETLRAVHDLTRVDLRNALINSGEDMGQVTVSNSKFAGNGSISREEAFNRLLSKGHSPRDIVNLAKQEPPKAK